MARTSGKCPVCGAIIHVNDEKETGHCGKCGAEINVLESIQLFQEEPEATVAPQQQVVRQQRREARAKEVERKGKAEAASQTIHDMFQLCTNEQDFLMLRPKIMEMSISDGEKACILETLDAATKQRLNNTLKKAKDYEESQESPFSVLLGCIVIVGIGLAINHFFSMTWPGIIAVGLAILGIIGNINDRHNKKKLTENKAAAELINQYRKLGYKL